MKKDLRMDLLRQVWLFERCNNKELALLAAHATPVWVDAGRVLAREGAIGREFFVVRAGRAIVSRNGIEIGALGAGSFFGEMALLDREPRAATVTTTERTEVLVLNTQAFTHVVARMPSVDHKMLAVLAKRLRDIEVRYLPDDEQLVGIQ